MTSFNITWLVAFAVLMVFSGWIGRQATNNALGILIDSRGRISLTHFQVVVWTLTILSSLIAAFVDAGLDASKVELHAELLGLMGISAGSAALATGVKAAKDAPGAPANIARSGAFTLSDGTSKTIFPKFSQMWLEEEGDSADVTISITKYQNFIFTVIALAAYVALSIKAQAVASLPANIVWMIGISHAGYVAGKVPDKQG